MQLKRFLPFVVVLMATLSNAQDKGGMDFIKADSWAEVVAKAKAENKYIFLDGYTTWCGPCITMAKKIFPLPEVGEFYNANFINLKVQLDTTGKDDDHVKKWYQDGHDLMVKYNIRAFPTYLFFSPDGEIVHRAVGSSDAQTFIGKGKDALNPDKQYYRLARAYDKGDRDPVFLRNLCYAARNAYDMTNMKTYTDAYLATQTDLLNEENIKFLADFTQSSKDKGFELMMKYPEKFDAVKKEEGYATNNVRSIIMNEEVFPVIFPRDGGNKEPDWKSLEASLQKKYPALAQQTMLQANIFYYQRQGNWQKFSQAISQMLKQYPASLHPAMLNSYAWTIFEECDDLACVKQAVEWSKKSLDKQNDPMFIDTYANLLHKTGKTTDAIAWQKKAISLLKEKGEDSEDYEATLAKMERGEKTW